MNSLSKALLVILAASASVEAGPAQTCTDQSKCLHFTIEPLTTKECGGNCNYKVCAQINNSLSGCGKSGAWSHTCKKSGGNPDECETDNGFSTAIETQNPNSGYKECQIVAGGINAQFLFKDGSRCDNGGSASTSVTGSALGASCQPSSPAISSCTGNGDGKECIWTVPTPPCSGGGGGDPHFRTYDGTKYSYHGECDLVMASSESFDNGLGLNIHGRTTIVPAPMFSYSVISDIAIRLGSDILEFNNKGISFLNQMETNEFPIMLAGKYKVTKKVKEVKEASNAERIYYNIRSMNETADVNIKGDIVGFTVFRDMIGVTVFAHFDDAEGMLGSRQMDGMIGRDHVTVINDPNMMGAEWQVTDNEPMLFRNIRAPQYPAKCIVPDNGSIQTQKRRLRNAADDQFIAKAEAACAQVAPDMYPFCFEDILRTGDLMIADGYAF